MVRLRGRADGLLGEGLVVRAAEEATDDAEVQAHGGGLVDHEEAETVGVVEHLLGVGIVGRAERVRSGPLQELEVVDHRRRVVALPPDLVVLVHPEPGEVHGLAVDEEPGAVDAHRTDADRLEETVHHGVVGDELDAQLVEVAAPGAPQLGIVDAELATCALALGDHPIVGVRQTQADLGVAVRHRGLRAHHPGPAVDVGDDREVLDVGGRRVVEPHAAMQPRVVEEVVEVPLLARAVVAHLDGAGRDRVERQHVVDRHRDPQRAATVGELGDVGLEGQVATFMVDDVGVVDPDAGPLRGAVEPQDHTPVGPTRWRMDRPLVPDLADVVMDVAIGEEVVVAGRHSDGAGVGERGRPPPLVPTDAVRVGDEGPDAVEALGLPDAVVLRAEHGVNGSPELQTFA